MLAGILLSALPLVADATDTAPGAAVFARWCVHCHGEQAAAPGRLKLAWTRGVERSVLARRDDLDAAGIRRVVRRGQLEMPGFRPTEISDTELEAVIAWLTRPR